MYAAAKQWLTDNPDDPEAPGVLQRAELQRMAYMRFGRDTLGFGLYLFRRPPS
jgi:hypothetical protein